MLGMGFVKSWSGLMSARFFLGVAEAGLFPGVNYYLSCWYKRDEFAVRAVSICLKSLSTISLTRHRPSSSPLLPCQALSVDSLLRLSRT
jgi:MFS family permease